jgi:hypothetical protein
MDPIQLQLEGEVASKSHIIEAHVQILVLVFTNSTFDTILSQFTKLQSYSMSFIIGSMEVNVKYKLK